MPHPNTDGTIDVFINGQKARRRYQIENDCSNLIGGRSVFTRSYKPELKPGERYIETVNGDIHIIQEPDHPER